MQYQVKEQLNHMTAGQRLQGYYEIDDAIQLPYTLIKGASSKPLIVISAGVHGCEYVGVQTTTQLAQATDWVSQGSVLLLHVVNTSGFYQRAMTVVPEDDVNLNRIFQSNDTQNGVSYRIRDFIKQEILPVANYVIDLHGGNKEELLIPHGYYSLHSNADVQAMSKAMLHVSKVPIIVESSAYGGLYQAASIDYQVPSIILEQGQNGACLPSDTQRMVHAVKKIVAFLLDKEPVEAFKPLYVQQTETLTSQVAGCWHYVVLPGEKVKKGQLLGTIETLFGETLQTFVAPADSIILYQKATLAIQQNEDVMTLAYLSDETRE